MFTRLKCDTCTHTHTDETIASLLYPPRNTMGGDDETIKNVTVMAVAIKKENRLPVSFEIHFWHANMANIKLINCLT